MTQFRWSQGAVVIVVTMAAVLAACAPDTGATRPGYVSGDGAVTEWGPTERGVPLDLVGTDGAGNTVDISDLRGDVVVVNVWYAQCPPCRAEAADLEAMDSRDGVTVVGVNGRDDAETVAAFERTFGVTYASIIDIDGSAMAALQGIVAVNAVPTTLVLDADGRVAARVLGRVEPSTLDALVEAAST